MKVPHSGQQKSDTKGRERSSGHDYGFGDAFGEQERLITPDGTFNVLRGRSRFVDRWSYAALLKTSRSGFLLFVVCLFIFLNILFACLYMLCGPRALVDNGPDPQVPSIMRAFFFSVHTLATIGYGNVVPVGEGANLLVVLESFTGLSAISLVTGLLFARFSRPKVRLRFSVRSVMRLGKNPALLVRMTNLSRNECLEVEASAVFASFDPVQQGARRYLPLELERSRIAFLPLAWTIVHHVTPASPFFGLDEAGFAALRGEIILQVNGIDEVSSKVVYARVSYMSAEVLWDRRFAAMYHRDARSGLLSIDMEAFDCVETLPSEEPAP